MQEANQSPTAQRADIAVGRANRVPGSMSEPAVSTRSPECWLTTRSPGSESATIRARNRKWKGSLGDEWMYNRSRWKAKMEILVQMLTDPAGSFQT